MSYVIYDKDTTEIILWAPYGGEKTFKTKAAGLAARTRMVKAGKLKFRDRMLDPEKIEVIERGELAKIEKQELVTNLLNGKTVLESVNTPYFMSVGSETYWSS
jgi:hypothetical protein